jgi:hypothetical protein
VSFDGFHGIEHSIVCNIPSFEVFFYHSPAVLAESILRESMCCCQDKPYGKKPAESSIYLNPPLRFAALYLTSFYFTLYHFITLQLVQFSPNLDSGWDNIFSSLIPVDDFPFALV